MGDGCWVGDTSKTDTKAQLFFAFKPCTLSPLFSLRQLSLGRFRLLYFLLFASLFPRYIFIYSIVNKVQIPIDDMTMNILKVVLVALSTFFATVAGETNQTYGADVVRLLPTS